MSRAATCAIALGLLLATSARAEPLVSAAEEPTIDAFQIRARYGASLRSGSQTDAASPGLSYNGLAPNDLALQAWVWPLLSRHLGPQLYVTQETFGLYSGSAKITDGGLVRAGLLATGRYAFGPLIVELGAGYGYHQLALFSYASNYSLHGATRHAVLLAARGIVALGPLDVEARGEFPLTLAAFDTAGKSVNASGFSAGGALRLQAFSSGALKWGLLAEAMFVSDSIDGAQGVKASQQSVRFGAGIDLRLREDAPVVTTGSLAVTVLDAATQAPLPGASVTVGTQSVSADPTGVAHLSGLLAGAVLVKGSAGGFVDADAAAQIVPGVDGALQLSLKKEPPKLGSVAITVTDKETHQPRAKVKLRLRGQEQVSDDEGHASFRELEPGPAALTASLDGYQEDQEAAVIVAGSATQVAVELAPLRKRLPASISGIVRSTTGKPIVAELELPEAKIRTRANDKGAFTVKPAGGGTYTVNIWARGYLSQTKTVTVRDGEQAIFNVELHPR